MNCECHNKPMRLTPWGTYRCRAGLKTRNRQIVTAEAEARGSQCERCSSTKDLEWHHRDPNSKFKEISKMCSEREGVRRLRDELEKCDLLCKKCHVVAQRALSA